MPSLRLRSDVSCRSKRTTDLNVLCIQAYIIMSQNTRSESIMEEKIKQIIADVLKVDFSIIEDDLSVGDIPEWDSLRHLMLIGMLGKEFDVSFSREELAEIEDVADIVELVKSKVK